MKYSLWHEKVRVGELFDDKPPIKGAIVLKVWRVVGLAWEVDVGDNTRSSGDVLVEPAAPEHIRA